MYTPVMELASFDDLPLAARLEVLRGMLEALIINNRVWLRHHKDCPPMYQVAPRYKLKVRPFGLDTWQDIPRTLRMGSGDCKDFACWRVAELRERGFADVSPRIKVGEDKKTKLIVYHIQVRQDLKVEDPSAILGMPPSISSAEARKLIRGENGVDGILESMRSNNSLVPDGQGPLASLPSEDPVHEPVMTLSGWTSVGSGGFPQGLETIFSGYQHAHSAVR